MKIFKLYKNAYGSGSTHMLYVPAFTGRIESDGEKHTAPEWSRSNPNIFSLQYTFFYDASKEQYMRNAGFNMSHCIPFSGDKWYINENNYISFEYTSSGWRYNIYVNNHLAILGNVLGGTTPSMTFPSWSSEHNSLFIYEFAERGGQINPVEFNAHEFACSAIAPYSTVHEAYLAFFNGAPDETGDPYDPGGTSDIGGGDGTFISSSDPLDFPDVPELSAAATGMVTLFSPTNSQLAALASFLWSTDFDLDQFKKMFSDPMAAIIGLSIVPVSVPTSGAVNVKFGGFPTNVSMNKASGQYVTVDCGSITVPKYWGNALDYNPYTKIALYLPYIGTHDLDVDEVIGLTIHVVYRVDILSGACIALVKCGDAVLYQFAGSCSAQVPVSNRDWSSVIGSAVSFGASAIMLAATGGASAAMSAAVAGNAARSVMSSKVNVQHSGSVGGAAGMLGTQTPYLIIKRARQSIPSQLNTYEGYPSNISATIGSLRGFTQIEQIHLENIPATSAELDEIESILKEGIII